MSSGIADINGLQLYYEIKGTGQPLLLLHAGIADSRMWDAQFEAFSKTYQVIRFDLRGFGQSNMPSGSFSNYEDVRALLDFLGIQTLYLLGISLGGAIAIDFVLAYPSYAEALILGAPSVNGETPSERIRDFWEEEEIALEEDDFERATELNLSFWVDGPHRQANQVDPALRQQVAAMQMDIFQKDIPEDIEEIELMPPAIERLREIQIPVQILVGELDLEEENSLADKLLDQITQSTKVVIPDAAHMLNMENPEIFNQNVLDFLAKV
ncbi:MAG: alpha/beta hydrolase [Cyanobacteria bacterium P01_F01_bin.86]